MSGRSRFWQGGTAEDWIAVAFLRAFVAWRVAKEETEIGRNQRSAAFLRGPLAGLRERGREIRVLLLFCVPSVLRQGHRGGWVTAFFLTLGLGRT